ncbi:phosphoethanolamine N-methyltransferase [Plasmodium ovale wallikeri]|uniref:phosphoethanolamine N-methyltransferase n=1 Tax=Plasmodium ovale wallikeri TaxID=864142 RepID=A0A1A8Z9Q8_PLAOA|nr:phosphoethanolamine N-methyltransferase [Plasmodium ovale wallikeri]SBT40697.1 phosphoethanolamine N-methyltransferase [Plasmodium ovale wallikeri]
MSNESVDKKYLESYQYSDESIKYYEFIFGDNVCNVCNVCMSAFTHGLCISAWFTYPVFPRFSCHCRDYISSGGLTATIKILSDIQLDENSRVLGKTSRDLFAASPLHHFTAAPLLPRHSPFPILPHFADIGSGLGGGCKYINEKYGSYVYGVDICEKTVSIAKMRNKEKTKIEFDSCDILKKEFEENSFDMIYSRDSILHLTVPDKKRLFEKCYLWLKPNGVLLITDYCADTKDNWDTEFKEYITLRKYDLTTIDEYGNLISSCNFKDVQATDISDYWLELLEMELHRLNEKKEQFLSEYSLKDYNTLKDGWVRKIRDTKRNLQKWGLFKAHKK